MIDECFKMGGFPLCRKYPIICIKENHTAIPVYNRTELYEAIKNNDIRYCFGVWLGKRSTDIFPVDETEYTKYLPPIDYRDIDNATSIVVKVESDGTFVEMSYQYGETVPVLCRNPKLFEYVKKIGLKYKTSLE